MKRKKWLWLVVVPVALALLALVYGSLRRTIHP